MFEPGLNMIIGRNGAGKTNALRGLRLGLTGDAGGSRPKAANINQLAPEKAKSNVIVEMEHSGRDLRIFRGLYPNANTLHVSGEDKPYDGAGAVNEALWDVLGVTRQQLEHYVFVSQGEIKSLIDMKPTARATEFAELFGTSRSAKIWDSMGDFLRAVEIPASGIDVAELEGRWNVLQEMLDNTRREIESIHIPDAEYIDNLRAKTHQFEAAANIQRELEQAVKDRDAVIAKRPELEATVTQLKKDSEDLDAAIRRTTPKARHAEAMLVKWETYKLAEGVRKEMEDLRAEIQQITDNIPEEMEPPEECNSEDRYKEMKAQETAINEEIVTMCLTIGNLEGEATECYACHQPLPGAEERQATLARTKQDVEAKKQEVAPYTEATKAYEAYKTNFREVADGWDLVRDREKRLKALESNDFINPPEESEEELSAAINDLEQFTNAYHDIATQFVVAQAAVTASGDMLKQLSERVDSLSDSWQKMPRPTAEQVNEANDALAHLRQLTIERERLAEQRITQYTEMQGIENQLAANANVVAEATAIRETLAHLNSVRDVFHVNAAPKLVSQTYLEQITESMNELLVEVFMADFTVKVNDELGFTCYFSDGRVVEDKYLSAGQQILLSWAERTAINGLFVGSLGLLVMDEPTAGLDVDNIGLLPDALDRLRQLSESRGLQVLFVTHELGLATHFANVIHI